MRPVDGESPSDASVRDPCEAQPSPEGVRGRTDRSLILRVTPGGKLNRRMSVGAKNVGRVRTDRLQEPSKSE